MDTTFSKSMVWLHSWAGVIVGSLLFAIFWMGTLSVFGNEIDRWMMPQTRLAPATQPLSLDRIARAVTPSLPAKASQWRVDLPTARDPSMAFSYRDSKGETSTQLLDPASYAFIPDQGTQAGSGFIVPFHYSLQLKWIDLGKWLVGLAAMTMLVMLVSGVVIHKKILSQFFTFRPRKRLQRSTLDLHNLSGVLGLPFHFLITLSGLVIFITLYFPLAQQGAYGSGDKAKATFSGEAYGRFKRPLAKAPGTLGSLDAMVSQAEREWQGGRPYFVRVWNPGDANSYVELRRSYAGDITMNLDQIFFDAASGRVLHRFAAGPVMSVQRFMSGLHFIRFDHWTLRWLYFLAGLSGCMMIATGFLFWLESRRARHASKGLSGVRVVEALAIGSITGIMLGTLAFFIANRCLPLQASYAGVTRDVLEVWAFYLMWITAFVHAWLRPGRAWREQAWLICGLASLAVLLNWLSTGDHLARTLASGQHAVAGMDLMLIAAAVLAGTVAIRLGQRKHD